MRFLSAFLLIATIAIRNSNAFPVEEISNYNSIALRDASPATKPVAHQCPNFAFTDPERYLGKFPGFKCGWKLTLICASLLLGCPAGCASIVVEFGNPFQVAECVACLGVMTGNCAACWDQHHTPVAVCGAANKFPAARCLAPLCAKKSHGTETTRGPTS